MVGLSSFLMVDLRWLSGHFSLHNNSLFRIIKYIHNINDMNGMSKLHVSCLVPLPAAHLLLSWDTSLDVGSFRARLTKFREGSRCLFSSTLEFHGKYLNKHSLVSLSLSEAFYVLSWDVKYVVSCITVCSSAVMRSYGGRTFIKHVWKLESLKTGRS